MLLIKIILRIIQNYQACHAFIHEWFPNDDPEIFIEARDRNVKELLRNPRKKIEEDIYLHGEDVFSIEIFGKTVNFTPLFVKFDD
jgi:hypothetical protein